MATPTALATDLASAIADLTTTPTVPSTSATSLDAAASSASLASLEASISSVLASVSSVSASAVSVLATATGGSAAAGTTKPASYKIIGLVLAVASGLFIGSSFVFKKKGLLSMQNKPGFVAGEGHGYLKSPMWWFGMTLMIIGEICNFVAYAFTEAILVTPLGALSVVICAVLSSIFLKEKLTFFGKIGCLLCILGSVIIALNGPTEQAAGTIKEFQHLFLAPGFLAYGSIVIVVSLGLMFWAGPRYGKKNMLVYIMVCSLIGGLSVVCTSGLGASILTSINGNNQFKYWFIYFLLGFVVVTLLTEINYLNKALELFNTAMVTPTYYVIFTFATLVTDVILNKGFNARPEQIVSVVFGFFTICCGIVLLQMSKIDPKELENKVKLDRRSTMLLRAASKATRNGDNSDMSDSEKGRNLDLEDPGVDSVRGFVGLAGSIHRAVSARRTISQRRRKSELGSIHEENAYIIDENGNVVMAENGKARSKRRHGGHHLTTHGLADGHITRHQLYDAPMPFDAASRISHYSKATSPTSEAGMHAHGMPSPGIKSPTRIGFNEQVVEHLYPMPGQKGEAVHQVHSLHEPSQQAPGGILQHQVSEFGQHLHPPGQTGGSTRLAGRTYSNATNSSILDAYSPDPVLPTTPTMSRPMPVMRATTGTTAATAGTAYAGSTNSRSGSSATGGSTIRSDNDNRSLTQSIMEHFVAETSRHGSARNAASHLRVDTGPSSSKTADQHKSKPSPRQKSPTVRGFFSRHNRQEGESDGEESVGLVGHSAEIAGSGRNLRDQNMHSSAQTRAASHTSYDDHRIITGRQSTDTESDRESTKSSGIGSTSASDVEEYQMKEHPVASRRR